MGAPRPQRAGEIENGTGRLATSAENQSHLIAFLFSLVWPCRKMDERDDGIGVREMVVKYGDGRRRIQHRPVRERKSDVLVVVQDSDPAWKTSPLPERW